MPTDIYTNYTGNFGNPPTKLDNDVIYIARYFDTSSVNLASGTNYAFAKAQSGMLIDRVWTVVVTAEGDATTLDIGDEDSATLFETDADLNATGVTSSADADIFYEADKDLWITPSALCNAAQFWVVLRVIRLSTSQSGLSVT
jgi:hypothetical protein